ncbi:MAG: hypothetical protein J6S85_23890 [Methanobrevibacter sp.]|nr:hypothetical protein [Methanobrevibacter sp.]
MEDVENKVVENNEQETIKEQEVAKKIAELAVKKRGLFAFIVRELYVSIVEDLTSGQEAEAKEDFFAGTTADVVQKIKDEHAEVYNAIKDEVIENLDEDELDDDFKERVASSYMEDKGNDLIARDCFNNMGGWEQRDFIKDCIDDL